MGSVYTFRVRVRAPDAVEDYGSAHKAAELFMEYGTKHQDWSIEVLGAVEWDEVECLHSEDEKHFTFDNEDGEEYWSEWWEYTPGTWIREQDCFNCGVTVEETRTDDA